MDVSTVSEDFVSWAGVVCSQHNIHCYTSGRLNRASTLSHEPQAYHFPDRKNPSSFCDFLREMKLNRCTKCVNTDSNDIFYFNTQHSNCLGRGINQTFMCKMVTIRYAINIELEAQFMRCLQKEMATYRHWSVSLWRDPDDVPHCRIVSPDKTEWRLISTTLCGWTEDAVS